jgi:hypothetical protein
MERAFHSACLEKNTNQTTRRIEKIVSGIPIAVTLVPGAAFSVGHSVPIKILF